MEIQIFSKILITNNNNCIGSVGETKYFGTAIEDLKFNPNDSPFVYDKPKMVNEYNEIKLTTNQSVKTKKKIKLKLKPLQRRK